MLASQLQRALLVPRPSPDGPRALIDAWLQGIQMQPPTATLFQERLLAGEWEGALELLPTLLDSHNSQQTEAELRDARCSGC